MLPFSPPLLVVVLGLAAHRGSQFPQLGLIHEVEAIVPRRKHALHIILPQLLELLLGLPLPLVEEIRQQVLHYSATGVIFLGLVGFDEAADLVVEKQMQPLSLSEEQLVCIFNLHKSCQHAEDALSQGMEALQHSLTLALSSSSLAPHSSGDLVDYASHMATAMSNVHTIQSFLHQADLLRMHALQQLQRILSPCQAARALLAINDYQARLRALSSLWLARPKE
ncbi:hypothetical protein SASPL_133173 [Salvia splendens]|uniref:DOG1 domain-containing protein n=1 Tax=Salvia splendens TaxID=180675 RepID=A0A8X8ZHU9_SALSN|nr:hypothetical protein SASPL_133173 [Salvia splendens]